MNQEKSISLTSLVNSIKDNTLSMCRILESIEKMHIIIDGKEWLLTEKETETDPSGIIGCINDSMYKLEERFGSTSNLFDDISNNFFMGYLPNVTEIKNSNDLPSSYIINRLTDMYGLVDKYYDISRRFYKELYKDSAEDEKQDKLDIDLLERDTAYNRAFKINELQLECVKVLDSIEIKLRELLKDEKRGETK